MKKLLTIFLLFSWGPALADTLAFTVQPATIDEVGAALPAASSAEADMVRFEVRIAESANPEEGKR